MNRIRLLPDHVANQIAAGEVVERPASVVKELVENAIDAQARRITIELDAGGRSLIRVTDDGVGMHRDDALMCLERHATSKIQEASDLTSIQSMGFRGEALPSIASVSRFTLTTRERDSESPEATRIQVQGGKLMQVEAAASPPGTTIEVRQLFYNLPARRKFLKTKETEKSHISQYLRLAALAHPEVGFKLIQDQRTLWHLNPIECDGSPDSRMQALEERMQQIEKNTWQRLAVQFKDTIQTKVHQESGDHFEEENIAIWGYIGAPGVGRSTRSDQWLFINRRPVENKALNFALREAYHTALMKGMHPVCCLFIELSPAFVDINVHPAKKEVRFHNEYAVKQCVIRAIKRTLTQYAMAHQERDQPLDPSSDGLEERLTLREVSTPSEFSNLPGEEPCNKDLTPLYPDFHRSGPRESSKPPLSSQEKQHGLWEAHTAGDPQSFSTDGIAGPKSFSPQPSSADLSRPPGPILTRPLKLVGVIAKLYVVLESDLGMVLMDQHAAHERVLFEQMLSRMEDGEAPSQGLLLPETIECKPTDADFLNRSIELFQKLGVGIREFGQNTFILEALPPFVKTKKSRQFLLDVMDTLMASGDVNKMRLGEEMIAKTVCRHAVKANDDLRSEELEKLLLDLKACHMPYTCPHGRPTLIEMSLSELDKRFGRIVG